MEWQEKLACVKQRATASDHTYNSQRMARALQALGYSVGRYRRRYRVTKNNRHDHPILPNRLDRDVAVTAPNQVWASDVIYRWTHEGCLYLGVVLYLYARKVVGGTMGKRLTVNLVCAAHSAAARQPEHGSLKSKRVHWQNYQTREKAEQDIIHYIVMFYNSHRLHSHLGYQTPDAFEKNDQLTYTAQLGCPLSLDHVKLLPQPTEIGHAPALQSRQSKSNFAV